MGNQLFYKAKQRAALFTVLLLFLDQMTLTYTLNVCKYYLAIGFQAGNPEALR